MQKGFSLVELSIVLVILGLLTGGVLAGQSLIRAAEIRKLGTEAKHYQTAVYAFRDKYFALPGDMGNATAFWGTAGGDGQNNTCKQTATTDGSTCNGNTDGAVGGWVDYSVGTPIATIFSNAGESVRFWQHLANAGMIEGGFDGQNFASLTDGTVAGADDENAPRSPIGNSYWMPESRFDYAGDANVFASSSDLGLLVVPHRDEIAGWGYLYQPEAQIIKPEEAYNLDEKMDDGFPATGKVQAQKTDCTDVSGAAPPGDADAEYVYASQEFVCGLRFLF